VTDPDLLKRGTDGIDIWRVDLADPTIDSRQDILSPDERQRADKFVFPKDRMSFSRSRCALRLILANRLGCQANKIAFRYAEHGKPELAEPDVHHLSFNLSHNEDIALIAMTKRRRVGVDVNRIGGRTGATDWAPIAKRSFSLREQQMLFALPQDQQEEAFYRTWTQKEAYTKALGDGFTYGFQAFTVVVNIDGSTGLLADDKHPDTISEWHISSLDHYSSEDNYYVAALAYDGAEVEIRRQEFVPIEP